MIINGQSQTGTIIDAEKQNRIFTIPTGITFTLQNITLTNGTASLGGAIYNEGTLTINQTTFTQNTAFDDGGAIYNVGTVNINQTTFTQNNAINGGAISNNDGTVTITQSTLTKNYANYGGAIENYMSFGYPTTLIINQSTLTENIADYGGAIDNYYSNVDITQSTFTQNTAKRDGGAIWSEGRFVTITQSTLTLNTAERYGGAIRNDLCYLTITQSTLTQNTAIDGGAIHNTGYLTLTQSTLTQNTANSYGGAILNWGTATITHSRIIGNTGIDVYRNGGTVNAAFNWWGSNFLGTDPISEGRANSGVIVDPWVILTVNATPDTINNGETSTITADLNHINGGGDLVGGHIPDGPIRLDINSWGSFINPGTLQTIILDTVNGAIIPISFYANGGQPTPTSVIINGTADGYTTTGIASAYININPVAYLNITKTANVTSANVGDFIEYVITLHNNGPDNADNITIRDILPYGTEFVSTPMPPSMYSYDPVTRELIFFYGTDVFGNGATWIQSFTVRVNATAAGTTLSNVANVTYNQTPKFNETTNNVYVNQALIELTKTTNNTRPNVGETVQFTIVARNTGTDTANNLVVTDTLPVGLDFDSCTDGGVWDPLTRTVTWPSAVVLNGANVTYYLTALVNSTSLAGTNVTNMVNETHTEYPNNSTTNCTIYVPKSDLYIQITSDKNNPTVGETFILTYKLGNSGPDDATNVTITIPIPDGFVISEIKGDGNWTIIGNTITWTFDNVTVGDPYLHITGWTTGPGIYLFSASIASETFSINSRGVSSLSLNAMPQVNAAIITNTVGMQNTGTSLAGIVLAILMVLGGFIGTRKK